MEDRARIADEQAPQLTAEHLTRTQVLGLMRAGFDTLALAHLLKTTEAEVYNKLAGET